ncbi:hypothetical protein ACH47B_37950 [Rhodococcus sp. NPDC019627]|uniref:hypothetical protein n=1 Tax=unclassified Rhodococcus (in: high G+C Gram-positive bacteria) TaxID=192944 RepID=UPI0033F00588
MLSLVEEISHLRRAQGVVCGVSDEFGHGTPVWVTIRRPMIVALIAGVVHPVQIGILSKVLQ